MDQIPNVPQPPTTPQPPVGQTDPNTNSSQPNVFSRLLHTFTTMRHSRLIMFIGLVVIVAALSVAVTVVNNLSSKLTTHQHANTSPLLVCGNAPTDSVLVMDVSGSMNDIAYTLNRTQEVAGVSTTNQLAQAILRPPGNHPGQPTPTLNPPDQIKPTNTPVVPLPTNTPVPQSGSGGSGSTKISQAKTAANLYVDTIAKDTKNAVGLVTFSNNSTVKSQLTNSYSSVKSAINSLTASGNTCTECGLTDANKLIQADTSSNKKVIILLTDGIANTTIASNGHQVSASAAETAALNAALAGYNANHTVIYTIGLGKDVNTAFLQKIASSTGGKYYFSANGTDLTSIYNDISQIQGKGSVTGTVFNDLNGNGVQDSNEPGLPNWSVTVQNSGTTVESAKTNSSGVYIATGLCDAIYNVLQTTQTGWTQTAPPNNAGYAITVVNGSSDKDKNFGDQKGTNMCGQTCQTSNDCSGSNSSCNLCDQSSHKCVLGPTPTPPGHMCGVSCTTDSQCASGTDGCNTCSTTSHTCIVGSTPTPLPGEIIFHVNLVQPGIGRIINPQPGVSYKINNAPVHNNRAVTFYLYPANQPNVPSQDPLGQKALIATAPVGQGVQYDDTLGSGGFAGQFTSDYGSHQGITFAPTDFTNGTIQSGTTYSIFIKLNQDLRVNVGTYQINFGTPITLTTVQNPVVMVPGDIASGNLQTGVITDHTGDNTLDILDYNAMIACIPSSKVDHSICDPQEADLNDKPLPQIAQGPTPTAAPTSILTPTTTVTPTVTIIPTPTIIACDLTNPSCPTGYTCHQTTLNPSNMGTCILEVQLTPTVTPALTNTPTPTLTPTPTGTTNATKALDITRTGTQDILSFWNDQLSLLLQSFQKIYGQ